MRTTVDHSSFFQFPGYLLDETLYHPHGERKSQDEMGNNHRSPRVDYAQFAHHQEVGDDRRHQWKEFEREHPKRQGASPDPIAGKGVAVDRAQDDRGGVAIEAMTRLFTNDRK